MARVITPPQPIPIKGRAVFLAGSSDGWQSEVAHALADADVLVLDPRGSGDARALIDWELEGLERAAKWEDLLKAVELTLPTRRFWLDLHRYAGIAMQNLGAAYAPAYAEVKAATGYLVMRCPKLLELAFNDGRALASDKCKQWISTEVMPAGDGGGGGGPVADERIAQATALIATGKRDDGLALLGTVSGSARGERTRFIAGLELGRALASGKTAAVADGVFEGLVRTIDATGLEQWEPELAVSCYRAYPECLQALEKPNEPGLAERRAVVYRRLCRLDPVAASKQV